MSSGPKNVTSTTSAEPPAFLQGPLTTAVNAAQGQFTGQPAGQPVQGGGLGGIGGRDFLGGRNPGIPGGAPGGVPGATPGAGPDLIGQGQGLIGSSLQGDFLSPDSNPFLQDTFNRAADLTQNRLSSEFAGAGRDLGAALPARSEELQTLASNIYGGNFQAERDRQMQSLDQSRDFDPLNLFINRLSGIIPGAGGTTQSTQPVYRTGIFSDRRLKRNIERRGTKAGYPWYSFEYIWGEKSEGYMSDELPQKYVSQAFGFDTVDYAAIGGG